MTVIGLGRSVDVRITINPCCSDCGVLVLRAGAIDTVPPSKGCHGEVIPTSNIASFFSVRNGAIQVVVVFIVEHSVSTKIVARHVVNHARLVSNV